MPFPRRTPLPLARVEAAWLAGTSQAHTGKVASATPRSVRRSAPEAPGRRCARSPYGTVLGVSASYLAFAGSVCVVPVRGSTHGHVFVPKKEGLPVR